MSKKSEDESLQIFKNHSISAIKFAIFTFFKIDQQQTTFYFSTIFSSRGYLFMYTEEKNEQKKNSHQKNLKQERQAVSHFTLHFYFIFFPFFHFTKENLLSCHLNDASFFTFLTPLSHHSVFPLEKNPSLSRKPLGKTVSL